MGASAASSFGALLKEYRLAATLTQEALAERAGVSTRNIQNLERGENRPLRDTARRLAEALLLAERERALLLAAVLPMPRRRGAVQGAVAAGASGTGGGAALAGPGHNLPAVLSSFIGREHQRARVALLLRDARLVTLVGTGGVGKTRLAIAVAEGLLDAYPDGVWLVELAPLADPALLPAALAQVVGLREAAGRPLLSTLVDHLRDQHLLLLLDNCEHLVAACAALTSALTSACPQLHILATSRVALGVAGEQCYRVPSLSTPDLKHLPAADLAGSYEAVRLFVERAAERRDDFALTPANVRAVAEVCARLDGIPLAVELAAARVGSLSVEGIAARMDDRFRLLTGGASDLPARQRTLRAMLDWSWDLLEEGERALLAWLAVFTGGWTLEAAEAVCSGEEPAGRPDGAADLPAVDRWAVLDGLEALVGKSLVQVDEGGGAAVRYRLLETVRQYAAEHLEARGAATARSRHLGWCVALAEEAAPHLTGAAQGRWLDQLEADHDNLRAALGWAREAGAAPEGMQLAGALWRFWFMHGHLSEGRGWLEAALAVRAGSAPPVQARALNGAGVLAYRQGDYLRALALHEEALALYRALDDRRGIGDALNNLGNVLDAQGEYARATALHEEALLLRRALGDRPGMGNSLNNLGLVAFRQSAYTRALPLFEEALAVRRPLGDRQGIADALSNLGMVMDVQGDYVGALALHEEALALRRALGDRRAVAHSLNNLGHAAYWLGDNPRALALVEESLVLKRALGDRWGIANGLGILGYLALERGDSRQAMALQEESLALKRALGDRQGIGEALRDLGHAAYRLGEYPRAQALLQEGIVLGREIGGPAPVAAGFATLAATAGALGDTLRAARLGGAAEVWLATPGATIHRAERATYDQASEAMRATLGAEAFAAAWSEGRALSLDEAVALARAGHDEASGGG